jgi:type I restriction enzyme, S subunit
LADIAADMSYGYTASATPEPVGPKFLRITDIAQERLDWDRVPYCQISDREREKYRLQDGDIVIARTGATVGYSKIVRNAPESVYASYLIRVRIDERNDPRYVGYVVGSSDYKQFVLANAGGAAQPNANAKVLTSFHLPLPPLRAQRKIACVLSAYDDLIENNSRRIKLVEEIAERIYREWFVDFRYPGHVEIGLKDSELGPIPKDWAIGTLDDLVLLQRGFDLPTQHRRQGGVPVVSATGIRGSHDVSRVIAPGVVTGRSGSIGTVQYLHEDFWPLNTTLWAKDFRLATPQFAVFVLRSIDLVSFNSGAAVPTLNRNDLATFKQVLPPRPLIARFSAIAKEMLDAQSILRRSTENMRTARDLLLPRLVSGEIDVHNLNIEVPEAA